MVRESRATWAYRRGDCSAKSVRSCPMLAWKQRARRRAGSQNVSDVSVVSVVSVVVLTLLLLSYLYQHVGLGTVGEQG